MDTDIKMGLESGLETVLVLSGVTKPGMIAAFPYKPSRVVNSVADLEQ
jgi:NagD protein